MQTSPAFDTKSIAGGILLQSHLLLSQISYLSMSLLMNGLRSSALEAGVLTGLDFSSQPHSGHLSPILKDLSLKLLLPHCLLSHSPPAALTRVQSDVNC